MDRGAVQLLKNLRQSVATLQICSEWGSGKEEATLQMSTERVWMQGRVPQKRLTTLQASALLLVACSHAPCWLAASVALSGTFVDPLQNAYKSSSWSIGRWREICSCRGQWGAEDLVVALYVQNMWNRDNGTTHEAFSLQFIFTTPGQRQVKRRTRDEDKWSGSMIPAFCHLLCCNTIASPHMQCFAE